MTGAVTDSANRADSPSGGQPLLLLLCATAALLEGFDTQSMGVAAPRVIAEFGLSSGQSAVIFSAATLGLAVGAAIGGRIADYLGRTRSLGGSLLLFGVFSLLTAATRNVETLFAARLLTGLGLGAAMPNFISLASESAPARHRLVASTLVLAAMPMGGVSAGLVALGAAWGWNWRTIFLAGGLAPLLPAIVLWRWPAERRGTLDASPPVDTVATVLFGGERALTTVLLWTGFFFTQLVLLLMLNWLPSLMIGIGFSRTQASLASICFNLSGSLGAIVLGRLHAGRRRRLWVITTYTGMALALTAVGAVGKVFSVAALACAFAGLFIIGAQLILFALAPLYYPFAMRGTGVGAAVAVGRLGSVIGPLIAGALLARGGDSATVLLAIVPFVVVGGTAALALAGRRQIVN